MKIKTLAELDDISGETSLKIPAGTVLEVDSDEGDYWIVTWEEWATSIFKNEAEVVD